MAKPAPFLRTLKKPWHWLVLLFIGAIFVGVAIGPTGGGMPKSYALSCHSIRQTRLIYQMLVDYEASHGAIPSGQSSTEIFQVLVDTNHLTSSGKSFEELAGPMENDSNVHDTAIFYLAVRGKTLATSTTLKPENVAFDVTVPLPVNSSVRVPAVFVTGYKVNYVPNGAAVPINPTDLVPWSGVTYTDNSSFAMWEPSWGPSPDHPGPYYISKHVIADFIPANFDAKGVKYMQLTPDGPMP